MTRPITTKRLKLWNGEKNRTLKTYRPCTCGCDSSKYGYLSGSNEQGDGFTLDAKSEREYQALRAIYGGAA